MFQAELLYLSLGALVCSTVVGIVTYNESNLYVGPGGSYFEQAGYDLRDGSRWDRHLIEGTRG